MRSKSRCLLLGLLLLNLVLTSHAENDKAAVEHQLEARLRERLQASYPCQITRVNVDDQSITITGTITGSTNDLYLAEVPLHVDDIEAATLASTQPITLGDQGIFTARVPRHATNNLDRLLSRWAVVHKSADAFQALSPLHYADTVHARAALPQEKPRNKKGLGGFHLNSITSDLDDLDISAVTVNVFLNEFVHSAPGQGRTPFEFGGRTWYADDGALDRLDKTLQETAKRHIVVSAIILVGQPANSTDEWTRLAAHPDAAPSGIFVMPNLTTAAGVNAYAAVLNLLAERYSRPDGAHGRIHHWILHNEVNSGWVWTNAGEKSPFLYMNLYQKSMRIAHLIARQYDPNARAFISLDHHWTARMDAHCYPGKELLETLLAMCHSEGDFDWGIAFHPYPQDLFEPRVWENRQAPLKLTAPKITFKNIEVLDAWAKQPGSLFQGSHRVIHLTEQGLNSRDYTEKSLADQAAGMAYAWNKFAPLETIEVFDYHNWIDNRGEGGLRIGLRKFPDEPGAPLAKKPIWFVYQSLGSTNQEAATAFAKPIIGITNWTDVRHLKKITAE